MKLKALATLALLTGLSAFVHAEAVTVSSMTVTMIMGGGSTSGAIVMNNSAVTVYLAQKQASASVAAGLPVAAGATIDISNYTGGIYGLAASGAGADVRVFKKIR